MIVSLRVCASSFFCVCMLSFLFFFTATSRKKSSNDSNITTGEQQHHCTGRQVCSSFDLFSFFFIFFSSVCLSHLTLPADVVHSVQRGPREDSRSQASRSQSVKSAVATKNGINITSHTCRMANSDPVDN